MTDDFAYTARRAYAATIAPWLKPGTKPPYPWPFRYWVGPHLPNQGPNPPLRPSPGRRAVTGIYVNANNLISQDYILILLAMQTIGWRIEFEVDGGGFSGSQDVEVSVASGDTPTQVRDTLMAALTAYGPPFNHCYARDVVLGDIVQKTFDIPPGPYVFIVDPNRAPLDWTIYRNHMTENSTHSSIAGSNPPLWWGEYEVIGLPARFGFTRAALPGPRADLEYTRPPPL